MPPRQPRFLLQPIQRAIVRNGSQIRNKRAYKTSKSLQQQYAAPVPDVKVSRRFFTWRRAALYAAYAYISYRSLSWLADKLFEGIEIEVGEDVGKKDFEKHKALGVDLEEESLEEDDEDALFIPLTYPQRMPQSLYKNSDPIWQEFKRLSQDKDRLDSVRNQLVDNVASSVKRHIHLHRRLGEPLKAPRFWLDFIYPDGPPPEYSRKGIELGDDYVAISQQIMPHADFVKLEHVVYPKAMLKALSDSTKIFYRLQVNKLKRLLGWELSQKDKQIQAAFELYKLRDAQVKAKEETEAREQQVRQEASEQFKRTPSNHQKDLQQDAGVEESAETGFTVNIYVPKPPVPADFWFTSSIFMGSLVHHWARSRLDLHPPGCCYLWGNVEIAGTRARAKLDVVAAYDPRLDKFIFVSSKVKHIWDKVQSAKGGL